MRKIYRNTAIPLYFQIQENLEEKILSGEWSEGYQIPTEKELSEYYSVSSITVQRAIRELVYKGLLYRIRAKGTFVSKKSKEENIFNLVTFGYKQGGEKKPHKILNSGLEEAEGKVIRQLELNKGDLVYKIDRLKIEEHEAIAIERTYIVYDIMPNFSIKRTENEVIYNVMRDQPGIKLGKAKIYLSNTSAAEDEAKLLSLDKGTPLMSMERTTYLNNNKPVEYTKFIMRQDKANYYFELDLE